MKVGYVYKLTSVTTNKVYIGSTILSLNDRLIRHRACFRRYNRRQGNYTSANELLMYPDCTCELVETVHFNDVQFLRERESYYILHADNCVNKRNPVFDYEAYYLLNKDRIKNYYQANKLKKQLYQRQRYNRIKNEKRAQQKRIINIELIRDF